MLQRDPKSGPQFGKVTIPKDAVRRFIGPGGSTIHGLQDRTGARIGVSDNGEVQFYAPSPEQASAVKSAIEAATGTGLQVRCLSSHSLALMDL